MASDSFCTCGLILFRWYLARALVIAVAVALVITAGGCVAPEPVLRMTPLSESVIWLQGKAAFIKEGQSGRVALAFDRQQGQLAAFHVEIENTGTEPFLIGPNDIYYAACNRSEDGQSRKCRPARWVADPEKVLLALDVARSRQVAGEANEEALAGPFVLLDLAGAIAGSTSRNAHVRASSVASAERALATTTAIKSTQRQHAAMFESERLRWASAALRKTTVLPGGRAAGMIYLPRDTAANEISVQVRVGKEILDFPFRQTLIDARPVRTASTMFPDRPWLAP